MSLKVLKEYKNRPDIDKQFLTYQSVMVNNINQELEYYFMNK
jgi:hypothetical protein